jgi:DNA relaxase NicK
MGVNVAFSGQALTYLRDTTELTDRQICARMLDFGGRPSRIDLAVTIIGGEVTPQKFHDMLELGTATTKARQYRLVKGKKNDIRGDTVYVGSRTSEKFARYYNKAAEMGIKDGVAMMRLEMELKGLHARQYSPERLHEIR